MKYSNRSFFITTAFVSIAFCAFFVVASVPSIHEKLLFCSEAVVHKSYDEHNHHDDHENKSSDHDGACFLCSFGKGQSTLSEADTVLGDDLPVSQHTFLISENVRPTLIAHYINGRAPPVL